MKKYWFFAVVLLLFVGCFSSCKKQCVCVVTRTTPTTSDTKTYEMGKMDEKDCMEYTGIVKDGDGVSRTLNCALQK
jgi:hypothetical protein